MRRDGGIITSYEEGDEPPVSGLVPGCRVKYHGNILKCGLHRTFEDNCQQALIALSVLYGRDINAREILEDGGVIEMYTESG